eukprot:SAG31_NODE_3096_length_4680_cov_1.703995_4_plen_86_part_00
MQRQRESGLQSSAQLPPHCSIGIAQRNIPRNQLRPNQHYVDKLPQSTNIGLTLNCGLEPVNTENGGKGMGQLRTQRFGMYMHQAH